MAIVQGCIRGKFGSNEYYQAKMRASEITSQARPAKETDHWADWGIEEVMQRDLNKSRIEREIVPYLLNSEDRFFGAVIILIYSGTVEFEPLKDLGTKVPSAYRTVAGDLGFLTIDGGELIILDGQHRLAAMRSIIQDETKKKGQFASKIADDEVSVIFVNHKSTENTRRMFNKVNRNAKPTTRSDNIITSEDDGFAIVTRLMLSEGAPLDQKKELVNWKQNTLAARSTQATTLSAVYETTKSILGLQRDEAGTLRFGRFDEKKGITRPDDCLLEEGFEICEKWWNLILDAFSVFQTAESDPSQIPDLRKASAPFSLLLKPAGVIVLFRGLAKAVDRGADLENAARRATRIPWSQEADHWKGVLIRPDGRVMARQENYDLTAELIAYMVASERVDKKKKERLRERFNVARGRDLEETDSPEELPSAISSL